jgi:hypothetical protein
MTLDPKLIARVKSNFVSLTSEELQGILTKVDRSQWSDEAFEAARQLLDERSKGAAREPATLSPDDALWHDGETVIVRTVAVLPPRCVRCNQAAASLVPVSKRNAPGTVVQCCVCPRHIQLSILAKRIHKWALVIGVLSFVILWLLVFELPGVGWKTKAVMVFTIIGLGIAIVYVWRTLGVNEFFAEHTRARGSIIMQMYAMRIQLFALQIGCLITCLLISAIAAGVGLLVEGWRQGFYPLVLLSTIPPVVGTVLLLRFKLRLSIADSQPGFAILEGTGARFRASLPVWPGYPRTTIVSSPGDVGRGS